MQDLSSKSGDQMWTSNATSQSPTNCSRQQTQWEASTMYEGSPSCNRNALTNESKATKNIVLLGEHVHRATLASAASSGLAKELAHDLASWDPFAQCMDMIAELDEARGYSFLTIVQVNKSKHFASIIHLGTHVLKGSPQIHVLIQYQALFFRNQLKKGIKQNSAIQS
ncbi:hypothetical protein ACJIZ3_007544 [Penstemon smallii]|uniref:Uncharacterized protein n=1 Tax=Penstemon smallii TaxID=265156 RepID=A0ABD3T888_9LAMI